MRILGLFLAAFAAILIFTGCESNGGYRVTVESPAPPPGTVVVQEDHHHHGPPPHAPAHGYRHKHQDGCDLVYDRMTGCYTVAGWSDYYFNDGFFFRFASDGWQISAHIGSDAQWDRCDEGRVPGGLKSKYQAKEHGKGNKGGKGKENKSHGGQQTLLSEPATQPIIEARWGKY